MKLKMLAFILAILMGGDKQLIRPGYNLGAIYQSRQKIVALPTTVTITRIPNRLSHKLLI